MDITDPGIIAARGSWLEAIDVVVNNAGVTREAAFLDQSEEDWDAVIDTNIKGVFLLTQLAGKAMRAHGRGESIISVASTAA